MSEKFSISGGSGETHPSPPSPGWPLPSHFHSLTLSTAIHQDPGRGRLPSAHKCVEQAIKLTLWQLFSHRLMAPRRLIRQGGGDKRASSKDDDLIRRDRAALQSPNQINQSVSMRSNESSQGFMMVTMATTHTCDRNTACKVSLKQLVAG